MKNALTLLILGTLALSTPAAGPNVKWDEAAARHLLSRTSFGGSPEEARRLAAMPLEKAVDELLTATANATPPTRPEWVRDVWINTNRRWADMSAEEYLILIRRTGARNTAELNDLRAWWLQQMITTPTPLRENLTLFWHGHFTSATGKVTTLSQAFYQQNATLRKHALGNFREFLEAITLDPAMLIYLDMEESHRDHPNENYARELLELFSLGVGNYTEKDILEIARALTGWTLDQPDDLVRVSRPSDMRARSILRDGLMPKFLPARHDTGEKTIFGKKGTFGLKDVLDLVVAHPACGRHVAGRMIAYFGAHDPEGRLRERMAMLFRENRTELRPMLRELLTSPEFYATEARGNQIKSPVRLLVGACRDLRIDGEATPALAALTVPLGQELLNPPTVKGWPGGNAWISASTCTLRTRLGETLVETRLPSGTDPLGRLRLTPLPRDPEQAAATTKRLLQIDEERRQMQGQSGLKIRFDPTRVVSTETVAEPDRLVQELTGRLLVLAPRKATIAALREAAQDVPANERVALLCRLLLASPEYQME